MSLTFEEWKNRPVYAVQCYTFHKACLLGIPAAWFRLLPAYRHINAKWARALVAHLVREERAESLRLTGSRRLAGLRKATV
jgi:hypothetical protein